MAQPNLQGFAPLPLFETWGRKRYLRCLNPHGTTTPWDPPPDPRLHESSTTLDDGVHLMRTKLTTHLHNTTPRQAEGDDQSADDVPKPESVPEHPIRRRRRSSVKRRRRDPSPSPPPPPVTRSLRARSAACAEKEQRRAQKFSVSLSKDEIDEDFYSFTGRRASGRPKRRPRAVRKHLELLFPGMGLAEITASSYDVVLAPTR